MRRFVIICLTAVATVLGTATLPTAAEAGFDRYPDHYDPYFYAPSPRGYYPYYNSGHWRSASEMRWRKRMSRRHYAYPQYNPAWGHPVRNYSHRKWHRRHHGGHHIGHW